MNNFLWKIKLLKRNLVADAEAPSVWKGYYTPKHLKYAKNVKIGLLKANIGVETSLCGVQFLETVAFAACISTMVFSLLVIKFLAAVNPNNIF